MAYATESKKDGWKKWVAFSSILAGGLLACLPKINDMIVENMKQDKAAQAAAAANENVISLGTMVVDSGETPGAETIVSKAPVSIPEVTVIGNTSSKPAKTAKAVPAFSGAAGPRQFSQALASDISGRVQVTFQQEPAARQWSCPEGASVPRAPDNVGTNAEYLMKKAGCTPF